ncbi:MarR family transcriptional regulator [Staphylococcus gallinarum]|uniref:MarR family transcriptional regulator n=1 Tax=Staphylococcus gallinarum TaxID=1293 RepID=A0A418HQL8_STAGA|nr:MarR family transcriptional regulator [Staphylococcus gallinarum]MCD8826978.1 MarR family transcriptional regulator [Staphylococcus gallinarum]PTE75407.1 MarR family transcriptional regulator [Staphylococcus gallinarum]RIL43965.1 MarR family transcriptional regulator [Staphylococcus gallinarum]RIO95916.1 MarR family transcriptional regulator [Staphylococcus gallinarum]
MVKDINNHIEFMKEFLNDINTLLANLSIKIREEYHVSKEQAYVIRMLEHEKALSLTEITERQGVNKAAVSRRIKKLINARLVQWDKSEESMDQRMKYIKLTELGKQFNVESKQIISDIVGNLSSDLSDEQIEQARYVLEIIDYRIKQVNIENNY